MIKQDNLEILQQGLTLHGKTNNNKLRESLKIKKGNTSFRKFMTHNTSSPIEYPGPAMMKNLADAIDFEYVGIFVPKTDSKYKKELENMIEDFYIEAANLLSAIAEENLYVKKDEVIRTKRIPIEQKIATNFVNQSLVDNNDDDDVEKFFDEPLTTSTIEKISTSETNMDISIVDMM
jgi:hypothetical protein